MKIVLSLFIFDLFFSSSVLAFYVREQISLMMYLSCQVSKILMNNRSIVHLTPLMDIVSESGLLGKKGWSFSVTI